MKKRFVFAKEVKELVAADGTSMDVPEGTRFSPEAADLIKEKGIKIIFIPGSAANSGKGSETGRMVGRSAVPTAGSAEGLIAVASSGKTAADQVGNVAARSSFFLIFNTSGDLNEVLENPYRDSGGGAGPFVAELMGKKGVVALVAGNFGNNIKASLDEKGIEYFEFQGRVGEAVKNMQKRSQ